MNWTYDSRDRLTQEQSTRNGRYTDNFAYDSANNPTTFKGATKSYNTNNQATANTYDNNGNPTTYAGTTCTFDTENRMTAYGTAMTAGYRADAAQRAPGAWKQNSTAKTYSLYDGELYLAELDSGGNVMQTNTWGTNGLVSQRLGSGTAAVSSFLTFDPQGSLA